jgi:hypothetical protein
LDLAYRLGLAPGQFERQAELVWFTIDPSCNLDDMEPPDDLGRFVEEIGELSGKLAASWNYPHLKALADRQARAAAAALAEFREAWLKPAHRSAIACASEDWFRPAMALNSSPFGKGAWRELRESADSFRQGLPYPFGTAAQLGAQVKVCSRALVDAESPYNTPSQAVQQPIAELLRLLELPSCMFQPVRAVAEAYHREWADHPARQVMTETPEAAREILDWTYYNWLGRLDGAIRSCLARAIESAGNPNTEWVSGAEALQIARDDFGRDHPASWLSRHVTSPDCAFQWRRPRSPKTGNLHPQRLEVEVGSFLAFCRRQAEAFRRTEPQPPDSLVTGRTLPPGADRKAITPGHMHERSIYRDPESKRNAEASQSTEAARQRKEKELADAERARARREREQR